MKHKRIISKALFLIIIIILSIAIYGSFELSINDFRLKDICPKILGVPACYLVTVLFAIGLVAHLTRKLKKQSTFFYLAIGLVCLMAFMGTLTELSGTIVCPRTAGGTPLCYISLGLCICVLVLKSLELFTNRTVSIKNLHHETKQ